MQNSLVIFRKEMRAYFNSPIAYIFLAVFLVLSGWFFFSTFFVINQASLRGILELIPVFFIFFIPAVTMRLVAEEKHSGTMEVLLTFPIRNREVIFGKFLAALALVSIGVALTGTYILTAAMLGNLDAGVTLAAYLGMILMAATYMALGLYASTITSNQIVAFILGILFIFLFFYFDKMLVFLPNWLVGTFEYLSVDYHYRNFVRGVFDSRDLIYFGSVIFLGLAMATRKLAERRWS
ncbi:MAG: ABC transporter permease subunit [Candidatus Delongbacteria bacterium]|nr:ABC transporter permease subunit [Candidatus Delongbacteria bacterium]